MYRSGKSETRARTSPMTRRVLFILRMPKSPGRSLVPCSRAFWVLEGRTSRTATATTDLLRRLGAGCRSQPR